MSHVSSADLLNRLGQNFGTVSLLKEIKECKGTKQLKNKIYYYYLQNNAFKLYILYLWWILLLTWSISISFGIIYHYLYIKCELICSYIMSWHKWFETLFILSVFSYLCFIVYLIVIKCILLYRWLNHIQAICLCCISPIFCFVLCVFFCFYDGNKLELWLELGFFLHRSDWQCFMQSIQHQTGCHGRGFSNNICIHSCLRINGIMASLCSIYAGRLVYIRALHGTL